MDLTRWRELRWQASALRANIQLKTIVCLLCTH
jgi:hypothetical protein